MRFTTFAFLLTPSLIAGCSDRSSAVSPTAPTPVVTPGPIQVTLRGVVWDSALRALGGARVEVLDGASAGTTVVAERSGAVTLTGVFDSSTRFRASHEGHETLVSTWAGNNGASAWLTFTLRPLATPPPDLAGDYTMTIAASASCSSLPAESRSRAYRASLKANARPGTADVLGFVVTLESDAVLEWTRRGYVGVAGTYASSWWATGEFAEGPGLVESLGGNQYVTFRGAASVTLTPASGQPIALTFNGSIGYLELRAPMTSTNVPPSVVISQEHCESTEHQMVLTRR